MSANATAKSTTRARPSTPTNSGVLLQRKCKCGSSKSSIGETCDECSSKALQRKVAIGASDDPFELEADRVADRVLANTSGAPSTPIEINRVSSTAAASGSAMAPPSVDRVLASAGRPLEPALKHDMENRFGRDFSQVRIHEGSTADESARDVTALAYTVGSNIVFASGSFSPGSSAGRRLLAHELTHVVQQTGAQSLAAGATQRSSASAAPVALMQRQPDVAPTAISEPASEIRWGYMWITRDEPNPEVEFVTLRVKPRTKERDQAFSNKYMAEASVTLLERNTSAAFKPNSRQILVDYIEEQLNKYGSQDLLLTFSDFVLSGKPFEWHNLFDAGSWRQEKRYAARQAYVVLDKTREGTLIARGDFGPDPGPKKLDDEEASEREEKDKQEKADKEKARWAAQQYQSLKKLIDKAREDGDRKESLPDDVVLWERKEDKTWHINVWLYFDKKGQDKKGRSIPLKPGERPEQLLERARDAFEKTLETYREDEKVRQELAMPSWALRLKLALEERLGTEKQRDVPDGMALVYQTIGTETNGPTAKKPADAAPSSPRVLLHIWVERGDVRVQRNSGTVPLVELTPIDSLEAYVRHLTVLLREYEKAPDFKEITKQDLGSPDAPMPPFKARILPQDLRGDKITITGGHNKFGMELNYEEQYQSGSELDKGSSDMYVASKLYSQTNFFIWRVFKVPEGLTPANKDETPIPKQDDWGARWKWLYEHYNPGARVSETDTTATFTDTLQKPPPPGEEVTRNPLNIGKLLAFPLLSAPALLRDEPEPTRDQKSRVNMPNDNGEYLVFCETRHKPWGSYDLMRQSAYAYYPLRTQTREEIVTPLVTATPKAIREAKEEIAAVEAVIAGGKADPAGMNLLKAMRESAQAHLDVLQLKEKSGLVEATAAEIKEGHWRLADVTKLKILLPEYVKRAKANNTTPSKLLENEPRLLALYWWLIKEQRTPESYERQLTNEVAKLLQVNERATDYKKRFKSGEDTCEYTPEAVFVSEVDGNIYPLSLMIGQVPNYGGFGTSYAVADVTTEQTKDFHTGTSTDGGDEGHVDAIDEAFEEFGEKATYGEGWIGVRMPEGTSTDCAERHTPGIKFYRSEEGTIEKVWKVLGLLAAVVGVAALVATGVGAPAAAALLGAAAGLLGAAVAIHNIQERSRKGTLKADAELALDILGIVGVGELAAVGHLSKLKRIAGGVAAVERFEKFLAVYRISNEVASGVLIPVKYYQDVERIKAMRLAPDVEKKLIAEAQTGAIQGGLMFLGASVGTRLMGGHRGTGVPELEPDFKAIRQQADIMALETPATYKSIEERWIDIDGKWTAAAPDVVRKNNVPDPGSPTLIKEGMEGVQKVNEGKVKIERDPETKMARAKISDDHDIVEVQTPHGIACEVHSKSGPRIPCPDGMGIATPGAPPPAPTQEQGGPPPPSPETNAPRQEQEGPRPTPGETTQAPKKEQEAPRPASRETIEAPKKEQEGTRPTPGETIQAPKMEQSDTAPTKAEPPPPQDLIKARKQLTEANKEKSALEKNSEGIRNSIADQVEFKNNLKASRDKYKNRKPDLPPDDPNLINFETKIAAISAELKRKAAELKAINKELPKVEQRIQKLEDFRKQFEGSTPWTGIKIGDDKNFTKDEQAFVGEIEATLGAQAQGIEPMGNSIRASDMLSPKHFETKLAERVGKPGLDLLGQKPVGDEVQFWLGEAKTEIKARKPGEARTNPTGTVGQLKTTTGGERQLSDVWNKARIEKFGLLDAEVKAVKEAYGKKLKNGEDAVKRYYALTDSEGTRFFEVESISPTEVRIGKEIFIEGEQQ